MSGKTCVVCSRVPKERFLCGGCNDALYCGDACQERHWQNGHAEHCEEIGASVIVGVTKGNRISPKEAWELIISRVDEKLFPRFKPDFLARAIVADLSDIMRDNDPNDTVVGADLVLLREERRKVLEWIMSNKTEPKPDSFNKFFPTFKKRNNFMITLFEAACSAKPRPGYDLPEMVVQQFIDIFTKFRMKPGPRKQILNMGFAAALETKNLEILTVLMQNGIDVNTMSIAISSAATDWAYTELCFFLLLQFRADPFRKNLIGMTSMFEYSLENGLNDVLDVIVKKYPESSVKYFEGNDILFFIRFDEKKSVRMLKYALEHNLYKIQDGDLRHVLRQANQSIAEVLLQHKKFTNNQIDETIQKEYEDAKKTRHGVAVLAFLLQHCDPSRQTVEMIIHDCLESGYLRWLSEEKYEALIIKELLKTGYVDYDDINKLMARKDGYDYRKVFLKSGMPFIELRDSKLLPEAADKKDYDFMELLLNFENVNVNAVYRGDSALQYICTDRKIELAEKLLRKGALVNNREISIITYQENIDFIELLLKYGDANVAKFAVKHAIKTKKFFLIRHYLQQPKYEALISTEALEELYETFPDLRNKVKEILKARETQKEAEEEPLKEAKEPPGKMRKE